VNGFLQVIITAPPYADHLKEITQHPLVSAIRLNTVMPIVEDPKEVLLRLLNLEKPIWVDLKSRQLRTVGMAQPPYTEIKLSHKIEVQTPARIFFSDGKDFTRIMAVDGNKIILEDGPKRVIGPGESVNIVEPTLRINGVLTDQDIRYLEAMKEVNIKNVMLSYVEELSDLDEVKQYLPEADVKLKIETKKGLQFARNYGSSHGNLVAARGDLFVEVKRPHLIAQAVKEIINIDPDAIVASRLLDSMTFDPVPSCPEIGDVAFLMEIGYRSFLLGDSVCFHRDTLLETLNLLEEIQKSLINRSYL
jgi:pyruvate kinase